MWLFVVLLTGSVGVVVLVGASAHFFYKHFRDREGFVLLDGEDEEDVIDVGDGEEGGDGYGFT